MRKTLKRNLSYDDRNHLYYVSLYYDGENGRRVRRTRTYPTMEQAEVPSRFMRKFICRLRLNEVSRQ